ncbi:discoidin domain-containing protein [Lachnospiraceae bacterium 46-15]
MKRKAWKKFLAGFLAAVCLPISSLSVPVKGQAADQSQVSVEKDGSKITIGNGYISREFSTENSKLKTTKITNKRTGDSDTVFTPADGSEEFKIRIAKVVSGIDREGWTATADSYQKPTGDTDGNAPNLIDGNLASIWHTKYNDNDGGEGRTSFPYNVIFTLGKSTTFQCFSYTPRQDNATNGNIKGYELYYSTSTETLGVDDAGWNLLAQGNFTYNEKNTIYVNLDNPCTATQLKLKATSSNNGANFAGGAEFNLHEKPVNAEEMSNGVREFASSALTLSGEPVVEETQATINGVDKTGQKITFNFEPYTFKDVEYTISEVIVMYNGDHFMRKYMEISVPEDKKKNAVIDYIDLESLKTNSSDATWTIPTNAGGIVQMNRFKANLGQPIYIQGMFFGCEFPAADNEIVDRTGYMRYYTGKSFDRMEKDSQLTQDGKYVTWQTVAGAARSTDNAVIQADFFEYIKSIATPSEFRIQYNSWFDNMMLINDENILDSFIEIDRELNQAEVRPLDSYVVDDGWVNYNNTSVVDAARAGTTLNQSGFWEFNSKFPEGLTPSSELVHKFGSNFGVWVGPRGGYNFYGSLADILVKSGKGSKAGGSIDVADRVYVENFTKMATDWMKEYGVNYWKWDGFADGGQYGAFAAADGVPGYANRHMTGGYEHMYHVTDLWEAWIDLMEAVRRCEKENNIKNLWISLTCYVNPSPWYLQWANSVWIQCTADQADAGGSNSKMDKQMTYRDAVYYDFLKNHQFQFPLSNIYNHDPVYGKEGTGMVKTSATDEQFKNYLYMLATRGTAFWELYFSDSIMTDGKYEVTGEFLEWAEENYHMLKNSKMFGASPNTGTVLGGSSNGVQNAYGYSCFDGTDGIISFRNSALTNKSVTITFDETLGVPENAGTLKYHMEHSHNLTEGTPTTGELVYGQEYTMTLKPDEVRILRVSKEGDTTAPEFVRAYSDGANEITVKFNEKVNAGTFKVNGSSVAGVEASADSRTFRLTARDGALTDNSTVTVTAEGLHDLAGNAMQKNSISFTYHQNNTVVKNAGMVTVSKRIKMAQDSLKGNNGFTVTAEIYTESTGAVLSQGTEYEIGINEDGTAYFTFNGATAVSKAIVNDGEGHKITAVKENNGMLKIYVDGQLEGAGYKEGNRYYEVKAADVVVGNDDFTGVVNARVADIANGYDVIEEESVVEVITPSDEQNWAAGKTVTAKWTADGSNAENNSSSRPMSMAVDGTKNTNNYGEFGSDNKADSAYMEVDLEEVKSVSKINLYRYWQDSRVYGGTVIMLSKTADFADKTIVYNSDAENFHQLGAGTDETYAESSSGKSIVLSEPVDARYVRVYMHGKADGTGKTNHVVELEVIGTQTVGPADYTMVDEAVSMAGAMTKSDYKNFSAVDAAIAAVEREKDATEQVAVNAMAAAIYKAISALEEVPAKKLDSALTSAREKNLDGYTEESVAEYESILDEAEEVLQNSASTEQDYTDALAKIKEAKNKLVAKVPDEIKVLRGEIADILSEAGEYTDASAYTQESWDAFQKAKTDAQEALDNPESTKAELEKARDDLRTAIDNLTASGPDKPNPENPNPENPDGTETVKKELGSVLGQAAAYKDASKYTPESWAAFQKALKDAQSVANNAASTKAEIEKARDTLKTAISALKPAVPTGQEPVEDGKVYSSGKYWYRVTSVAKKTVEVTGIKDPKITKITVYNNVTFDKQRYKVTSVAASAFKNNKKATSATIGTNVEKIGNSAFEGCVKLKKVTIKGKKLTQIGSKAFAGCKKLKSITIKSKKLKKVGKNAFKGIYKKAVIKVPSAKLKAYKKLLAKKGQSKTVKIKK